MKNSELRLAIMQKRIELNLTQTELANALHVSQKSVSMWENGETVPREPMRIRLAQFFELPIDYFLDTDDIFSEDKSQESKITVDSTVNKKTDIIEMHDEVDQLAESILNKYNDQHIDFLITKLKKNR